MATLSTHHKELDANGEGKCSVPMWQGGLPAGFCDSPAYSNHANKYVYDGYVPALACPGHGGLTKEEADHLRKNKPNATTPSL